MLLYLQEYIKDHGGDPDDCEEKRDLIEKATEIHDKQDKEVRQWPYQAPNDSTVLNLIFLLCKGEQ